MAEALRDLWERVRATLEVARGRLDDPDDESLSQYEDFLGHNELGLALDVLTDVALSQRASGAVWRSLREVVVLMELEPDDAVHGDTVKSVLTQADLSCD